MRPLERAGLDDSSRSFAAIHRADLEIVIRDVRVS
jgi:hypothetical protein